MRGCGDGQRQPSSRRPAKPVASDKLFSSFAPLGVWRSAGGQWPLPPWRHTEPATRTPRRPALPPLVAWRGRDHDEPPHFMSHTRRGAKTNRQASLDDHRAGANETSVSRASDEFRTERGPDERRRPEPNASREVEPGGRQNSVAHRRGDRRGQGIDTNEGKRGGDAKVQRHSVSVGMRAARGSVAVRSPPGRISPSTTQPEQSGAPPAARQAVAGQERSESGGKRALSSATPGQGGRGRVRPQGAKRPFEAGDSSGRKPTEVKGSRGAAAEAKPRTGRGRTRDHPTASRTGRPANAWAAISRDEAIRAGRSPHSGDAIRAAGACRQTASPPTSPPDQRDRTSWPPSSRLVPPRCARAPQRPWTVHLDEASGVET